MLKFFPATLTEAAKKDGDLRLFLVKGKQIVQKTNIKKNSPTEQSENVNSNAPSVFKTTLILFLVKSKSFHLLKRAVYTVSSLGLKS